MRDKTRICIFDFVTYDEYRAKYVFDPAYLTTLAWQMRCSSLVQPEWWLCYVYSEISYEIPELSNFRLPPWTRVHGDGK